MKKQLRIKKLATSIAPILPQLTMKNYIDVVLVGGPFDGHRVKIVYGLEFVTNQSPHQGVVQYNKISVEDSTGHSAVFYKYSRISDVVAINTLISKYKG